MCAYFKIAMFITSFLPLWITIAYIDVMALFTGDCNLYTEKIGFITICVSIVFSFMIIKNSMNTIKNSYDYTTYRILEASPEKGITSEFLLAYILPLFTFDFKSWFSVSQFLIYFVILAYLCIRNNNVYANLIFELKGYKFYVCDLQLASEPLVKPIQCIVLSKNNLTAERGNTIKIASLNKPFYLNNDTSQFQNS